MKKDLVEILYENRTLVLIVSILLVVVIGVSIYFSINNKEENPPIIEEVSVNLRLFGNLDITLEDGEKYQEPGYYAVDSNGVIKTNVVMVNDDINYDVAGTYHVTYEIDGIVKTRAVTVLKKETSDPDSTSKTPSFLTINLKGDNVITLTLGDTYVEEGYEASSNLGEDLTDRVTTNGEVVTSIPGTYTITYRVEAGNLEKEVIRTIIVLDNRLDLSLSLDKTSYTNSSVTITAKATGSNFTSLVLPNNVVSSNITETYNVTENGTYTFKAYNKSGNVVTKSIEVNIIDRTEPSGYCNATINEKDVTMVIVNATDSFSGIKSYSYYNGSTLINSIVNDNLTYNGKLENVNVRVYDKAGNYKEMGCNVTDNSIPDRTQNKLILIGDSRTNDMCKSSYCNACKGDKVIAKGSMGYSWFVNTAIPETNSYISKNPNESYNIFILMGVNGIGTTSANGKKVANSYYKKVESLVKDKWKNQYVYYVSINGVINSKSKYAKNAAINSFNSDMKSKIKASGYKNFKYCDTNSKISVNSSTSPDGVHYNCTTYRKIHDLLKKCL